MDTMQALRIELEGDVTSFRYPHFMWGMQPTFEMPPPATIYGHVCSAVGEWIIPDDLLFAYRFTHDGKFMDLEHIHASGMAAPISPQKRKELVAQGLSDVTVYGESTVTPFQRELLFRPRLTLYLNQVELLPAFERPHYVVVLGRSQDLCTYPPGAVQVVTLEKRANVYFEHTLLPLSMGAHTRRGVAVMMPRLIDFQQHRHPTFAQYLMLTERVFAHDMQTVGSFEPVWCDPLAPQYRGCYRAVVWHRFIEG
ncbi:MAG: CRISPR-associated protein Cas5 [Chloroflexi bacterium]|nr:CRISPR-associated protein Cas5 [Chloroflexota bacterium]